MRTAILTIVEPPSSEPAEVRARPLALRQLDFAAAWGCRQVLALAERETDEALALADRARAAGMQLRFVRNAHGLLGAVSAGEELLVLSPELLPEAPEALALLRRGGAILTLPADAPNGGAVAAGFERIDRDRAWAGIATMPGSLVERLADLPADSDPAAALLRIALQAGVPERALAPEVLEDGSWTIAPGGRARRLSGEAWLKRHLRWRGRHDVTGRIGAAILKRWSDPLLYRRGEASGLVALAALLTAIALVLPVAGLPAWGLAALVPAVLAGELGGRLTRLAAGPFGAGSSDARRMTVLGWAVDAALLIGTACAIQDDWPGRVFPPLVLLGSLHLPAAMERPWYFAWAGDRMVLAALLAVAAAVGMAEPLAMALALIVLGGDLWRGFRDERENHARP